MRTRITRNAGTLTFTKKWFVNETQADVGDVNLAIVDLAGNVVQASVAATQTGSGATTAYTYDLTSQADLNYLIVTWTPDDAQYPVFIDDIDVVGHRLFTIGEVRSFQEGLVSDTGTYTANAIDVARLDIEDLFEKVCRISFIPRYTRQVLDGMGRETIFLNRSQVIEVKGVTEDGTALTLPGDIVAYEAGDLRKTGGTPWSSADRQNVVVEYEHGFSQAPAAIARAGKTLLVNLLAGSDVLDRAIVHTDETGTYRLAVPDDRKRPTGIPEVDAILAQYYRTWGVV